MKNLIRSVWYRVFAASILIVWFSPMTGVAHGSQQDSYESEEEIKQLIVMIKGNLDDIETIGAGIIFGLGFDRLYIATANHVVREGGYTIQDLRIQLKSLPGESIKARLLDNLDENLDLAVISVVGLKQLSLPLDRLPFDRLGDADALKRRDEVFHVGYPLGKAWRVNVDPDKISKTLGEIIKFESSSINPGNSGGGLFNARWELVGMVRADQPPDGEAVSIQTILDTLKGWGYPINLKRSDTPGPTADDETSKPTDTAETGSTGFFETLGKIIGSTRTVEEKKDTQSSTEAELEQQRRQAELDRQRRQAELDRRRRQAELERQRQQAALERQRRIEAEKRSRPLRGVYTIQQVSNMRYVDAHEHSKQDYRLVTRPRQNNDTQRWIFIPLSKDLYTIQQKSNKRYVDAHETANQDYRVVTRPSQNNSTQRWIVKPLGNNTYTIQQQKNRRFVDAHEHQQQDYRLVTRPRQNNKTQRWLIKPSR